MKCPKCSYVSHDYLDACRKCSTDLGAFKRKFNLIVLQPGDIDLGVLVDTRGEGVVGRGGLSVQEAVSDMPPSASLITGGLDRKTPMGRASEVDAGFDRRTGEIEIDIDLDAEPPDTSVEPGELTKTFYVPEALAAQPFDATLPERNAALEKRSAEIEFDFQLDTDTPAPVPEKTSATSSAPPESGMPFGTTNANTPAPPRGFTRMFYMGLDEMHGAPGGDMPPDHGEPLTESGADGRATTPDGSASVGHSESAAPLPALDMRVRNLDDYLDEFDDVQLDTTEIDHDIDLALSLPATAEIEAVIDADPASKDAVTDDVPAGPGQGRTGPETGRKYGQE